VRILVTGGSGFIGKNLSFPKKDFFDGVYYYHHNDDVFKFKEKGGEEFDGCIHLAGNGDPKYSVDSPTFDLLENPAYLIFIIPHFKIKKFIYMSSGAVYDGCTGFVNTNQRLDPKLPYAISKLASEQYIKYFQKIGKIKEYIILRHFGSFGPHEPERKVTTRFLNGDFKIRGDGKNLIDLMYVKDTIVGLKKVLYDTKHKNKVYDFCMGNPITIEELAETVQDVLGIEEYIDCKGKTCEPIHFRADPTKFNKDFDFEPEYTLEEGIKEFMKWQDGQ